MINLDNINLTLPGSDLVISSGREKKRGPTRVNDEKKPDVFQGVIKKEKAIIAEKQDSLVPPSCPLFGKRSCKAFFIDVKIKHEGGNMGSKRCLGRDETVKITLRMQGVIYNALEETVNKLGYTSISEFIRVSIREKICRESGEQFIAKINVEE